MISYFLSNGRISQVFLICLAYFLTLAANVSEASKRPVKVGIYDIEPLCETKGTHQGSGLFVEILKYVALKEKWDLRMIGGSLKDGLDRLFLGEIDLLVASDYSKENEQTYNFTRETVISTWGQVYGPKKTSIGSLLDLSGNSVGVVRDDPYNQGLRDMLKRFNINCKFVEFTHSKEVFHAIEKGWVDAGVVDRLYGMQHQGEYGVVKTPIVLTPVELRFAAPKEKGKDLIEALDYHLKKLKDDPDSIYYRLVNGIFGVSANSRITRWLIWGIGIAFLTAFLAVGISLFLKRQIRAKTAQLTRKNAVLDTEIQKRHEAQEALLQSEGRYRSLVENTLDGYFVFEYPSVVKEQGEILIQGTLRDITEQERLKQHLQHAEKMEAVGTLAGGIAHDFNNLLMGIVGNASLLKMDLDVNHPYHERLNHIEEYVQSGSELTRQLLGFARGGKYEVKALGLNAVVEKTSHMFGRTRKEIRIHTAYGTNEGIVRADQGQVEQVLLNMYVNAWHAMPGGGDLYLRTETVTVDENHVRAHQGKQGSYVRISITDTGVGMDEKTQKRIFEPFFTTKEMGRGSGLGLASAYGIIQNHGGFIDVYSEMGKGTTFNIYLPVANSEKELGAGDPKKPSEVQKGEGTVLVVDDEEMIVDVGTRILERIGYRVLSARSGEEALKIYREKESAIDMVILDMIMPGMGGGKTFEGLKQIDPSVKVILSSGYSINSQASEILNRGCRGFIQKPFSVAELSRKLGEVSGSS